MTKPEHLLERRAHILAGRIKGRTEMLRNALSPAGQRPPFTEQLSNREALDWWQKHRNDDMGRQVTANMTQSDLLELDTALGQFGATNGTASGSGLQI